MEVTGSSPVSPTSLTKPEAECYDFGLAAYAVVQHLERCLHGDTERSHREEGTPILAIEGNEPTRSRILRHNGRKVYC